MENNKKIYFDIYVQSLALLFDSKSIRSVHFCGAYSMPGFEHLFPFRTWDTGLSVLWSKQDRNGIALNEKLLFQVLAFSTW